jgi:lipid-A-disaccharide synthase
MLAATRHLLGRYDIVIAGAPSIPRDFYAPFLPAVPAAASAACPPMPAPSAGTSASPAAVRLVFDETYPLLATATAALVTSGTATLETCMFRVPQVVCYNIALKKLMGLLRRLVLKVKYVSLVNLIADREVVPELVADSFSVENIRRELEKILPGGSDRQRMLNDYEDVHRRLGDSNAPDCAATLMVRMLTYTTVSV